MATSCWVRSSSYRRSRMWAAIQFFSRSARIAAYSSRAARYSGLGRARLLAAWAVVLPWGLTSLSARSR